MIKKLLKKHIFTYSFLDSHNVDTIHLGTMVNGTLSNTLPNQFNITLSTGVGMPTTPQLILDNDGTLNVTNRVQHIGSVFFDFESRQLKVYDGTEWIILQQL